MNDGAHLSLRWNVRSVWVVWVLIVSPASAQTNYSKTSNFPPIRISVSDLQNLSKKANSLITVANATSKITFRREQSTLGSGALKIKIQGFQFIQPGARLPKVFDSFQYDFSANDDASINGVNLDFRDFARSVTVSGNSPDEVDAVFSALSDEIQEISTPIGGLTMRAVSETLIFVFGVSALLLLIISFAEDRRSKLLIPIVIIAAFLILLALLPLDQMFGGFIAVSGDASFVVRYGPQISFVALLLAAAGVILPFLPLHYNSGKGH